MSQRRAVRGVGARSAVSAPTLPGGIVTGWNQPEIDMFGRAMLSHTERYACAEEWLAIVRRLWTEDEPFDHYGARLVAALLDGVRHFSDAEKYDAVLIDEVRRFDRPFAWIYARPSPPAPALPATVAPR